MTKLALLTGGSGAIGGATAALLRERGWSVEAPTRKELDFDNLESVAKWINEIESKRIKKDAIIYCHGEWYSKIGKTAEDFTKQYLSRLALPLMGIHTYLYWRDTRRIKRKPCVVMVASTRGFIGGVNTGPYAAACAAQIALMQGYAREWPGVRFNCVAPGHTAGRMGDQVAASGGAKAGSVGQDPAAVAAAIVGLVEGDQTGQVLRIVDGQVTRARWVWE